MTAALRVVLCSLTAAQVWLLKTKHSIRDPSILEKLYPDSLPRAPALGEKDFITIFYY